MLVAGRPKSDAMGQFGRITTLADLPPDEVLIGYVRQAAALNAAQVKLPQTRGLPETLVVPDDLARALRHHPEARETFESFSYSRRKEYAGIADAKRPETRARRVASALEWLAEGKPRNWKHL
ncbi:MAG: YdeI/OmpD-associated family protein [Chthoniobacterales bacterium]